MTGVFFGTARGLFWYDKRPLLASREELTSGQARAGPVPQTLATPLGPVAHALALALTIAGLALVHIAIAVVVLTTPVLLVCFPLALPPKRGM